MSELNKSRQQTLFQQQYVSLLGGDIPAALMLSQLVYWYMPDKNGKTRQRVRKGIYFWIAKSWQHWKEELGLSRAQSRHCIDKLVGLGLIEKKRYRFDGTPMIHVRFPWVKPGEVLHGIPTAIELQKVISASLGGLQPNGSNDHPIDSPPPFESTPMNSPLASRSQSITENTSETTTEIVESESKGSASLPIPSPIQIGVEKKTVGEEKKTVGEEKQDSSVTLYSAIQQDNPIGSETAPSSGWMKSGKPLPKKLMPKPGDKHLQEIFSGGNNQPAKAEIPIPTSAMSGVLGSYWKVRLDELEPGKYHAPVTKPGYGMLAHLGKYLGDKAGAAIDFVLRNWETFKWQALDNAGEKRHPPKVPNIGFLLQYHATAVNMLLAESESKVKNKAPSVPQPETVQQSGTEWTAKMAQMMQSAKPIKTTVAEFEKMIAELESQD